MRKLKKLASLLLALMMCFGLTCPAFAADTGSITITNASEGETYSVYKLLDVTYNSGGTSYAYTIDSSSEWYEFFTSGAGATYVSVSTSGVVTWTMASTGTDSEAKAFAAAALAYAEDNNIDPTAYEDADDSGTLVFEGLEYGYYLVDSSLGSVLTLDSAAPDVEVTDKNTATTVDKTVMEDSTETYGDSNTADVGEVVSFKIEITGASGSSNVVLHDTLSDGLTLNTDSFTVKVGTSLASADNTVDSSYYTIKTTAADLTDGCTFEIVFTEEYTTEVLQTSQIIVVEYTATVNADAVIYNTGNENETYVSYGNNAESTHDTTTTYVYELYVYKYTTDSTDTEVALDGAKFVLYKTVNNVSAAIGSDGTVTFADLELGLYLIVQTTASDNQQHYPYLFFRCRRGTGCVQCGHVGHRNHLHDLLLAKL